MTKREPILTEAAVLKLLRAIERGDVVLTPDVAPAEVFAGEVAYTASNGWRIAIFNDANEWDYIEWIEAGQERLTYDQICDEMPSVDAYEPTPEVAQRAYGISRTTGKARARIDAPEQAHLDDVAFDEVRRVLAGERRAGLDGDASKMLRILLGGRSADSSITRERFVVHFGAQKQRKPCAYFRRLAPPVLSELLSCARILRLGGPTVLGLPAVDVPRHDAFPAWSHGPKLVWVIPGEEAVKVIVRDSAERWLEPYVGAIAAQGPMALRELPAWAPTVVWTTLDEPLACPRCGAPSSTYRALQGALVCGSCKRSFDHAR